MTYPCHHGSGKPLKSPNKDPKFIGREPKFNVGEPNGCLSPPPKTGQIS